MGYQKNLVIFLIIGLLFIPNALAQWYDDDQDYGNYPGIDENENGFYPDPYEVQGDDYQNEGGEGETGEEQYYTSEQPDDTDSLSDMGPADQSSESAMPYPGEYAYIIGPSSNKCALWIVDKTGLNKRLDLKMPLHKWARMELVTCSSGNLVMYESLSGGQTFSYDMGPKRSNWKYTRWFNSDSPGVHTVWYTIGGQKSNKVTFIVEERTPPQPPGKCSVWADKAEYGVGETVTISYYVSRPCTIKLTILKPDNTRTTFGPKWVSAGTHSELVEAYTPRGQRQVILETWDGLSCRDTCYFSVSRAIPYAYTLSPSDSSEDESGYLEEDYEQPKGDSGYNREEEYPLGVYEDGWYE